jgi:hypothetical protein
MSLGVGPSQNTARRSNEDPNELDLATNFGARSIALEASSAVTMSAGPQDGGPDWRRYDLQEEAKRYIADRIRTLQERIEQEPRSFGWKMHSKIENRKRWYE